MNKDSKIYVTGAEGLVGSAVVRQLQSQGYTNIICTSRTKLYHNGYSFDGNFDLRDEQNVKEIFKRYGPEYVINAAGVVGGINANNTRGAEFIHDNILMQTNIIHMSYLYNVKKLLFLGSSCIYPKICPQPIKEEYLLTSNLEETNIGYAIAKISGLIMCRMYNKQYGSNFISAMPTNLYGPCFSEDTEVLTINGIKNIKDIKTNDLVYTLNPKTHNVEITKVIATQDTYNTDEFFHFKGQAVDFKVTPDHNMYYKTSTNFVKRPAEFFRKNVGKTYGQITFADFNIIKNEDNCNNIIYSLKDYIDKNHINYDNKYVRDTHHSHSKKYPINYNILDWAEFLGWYISEGSSCSTNGQIRISQCSKHNPKYYKEIEELLIRMEIPHGKDNSSFYFSSRLFNNYIKQNIGIGSHNKRIPIDFLKYEIPYILKLKLFETLMKGDGHKDKLHYTTSSKQLNLDFKHLCFLLGYKTGGFGRIGIRKAWSCVKYKNINIENVNNEKVYCITTEKNNIIYAGRNFKLNWIGQCDNFHLMNSHVLPALIRKFHDAKLKEDESVEFWGTGTPRREFLFVDDLAEALIFLMNNYDYNKQHINIGTGEDISIKELVQLVKEIVDYDGKIRWNVDYPDGTMVKRLDVSRINEYGWKAKTSLREGLKITYKWFIENYENIRK